MQQYFVEESLFIGAKIKMNEDASHHIVHVLRMKNDDCVFIANGQEQYYGKVLIEGKDTYVICEELKEDVSQTSVDIHLGMAMIKKDKWDFLLMKAAELGVKRIIPFFSKRCVVKAKEENNDKKMNRYRKILLEACEQCKRSSLVELAPMSTLLQCRDMLDADIKLIAYESADVKSQHIKDVLSNAQDVKSVAVVIGCEGGFSEDEVATFEQAGFIRVSLGGRILRAETAAMAAITMIDYHYC